MSNIIQIKCTHSYQSKAIICTKILSYYTSQTQLNQAKMAKFSRFDLVLFIKFLDK